ncbi:MAG: AI-2E family transporter [Ardenticatenaceae bacterium]|nr:AI-2E family transporter [Ardenticatenaceae bacterium]MCB8972368.1 AI-2E family transporter [Ardenticatenaceae bacterium]
MAQSTKNILILLVGLAGLALLAWLVFTLQPLIVALTISALLGYLLNPLVKKLAARLKGNRPLAATLIYLLVLGIFAGLFVLLGAITLDLWPRIQHELSDALAIMQGWLTRPFPIFGFQIDPTTIIESLNTAWSNAISTLTIGEKGVLSGLTQNLLWTLVVLVSFFYFLKDGQRIHPWLLDHLPLEFRSDVRQLLTEIDAVWSVFLRVQLFIFAVLAVLIVSSTTLIIWLFRQGWLPLSPIGLALLLVGVYAAIQQVDNLWLRPQLMGQALKLHPGIVFVSLIAALALSGLLGALLVVPILATVKVLSRYVYIKLGWRTPETNAAVTPADDLPLPKPQIESEAHAQLPQSRKITPAKPKKGKPPQEKSPQKAQER